jgi:hypothetical protein
LVVIRVEHRLDLEVDLINSLARHLKRDVLIKAATDGEVYFAEGIDAQRLGDSASYGVFANGKEKRVCGCSL